MTKASFTDMQRMSSTPFSPDRVCVLDVARKVLFRTRRRKCPGYGEDDDFFPVKRASVVTSCMLVSLRRTDGIF